MNGTLSPSDIGTWTPVDVGSNVAANAIDLSQSDGEYQYADLGSGSSLTITASDFDTGFIGRFYITSTADVTIVAALNGLSSALTCTTYQQLLVSKNPSGTVEVRLSQEVS